MEPITAEHGKRSKTPPEAAEPPSRSDGPKTPDGPNAGPAGRVPQSRRWRWRALAVVLLLAVGGGVYWYLHRNLESTDDAFVDGNAIVIAPRVGGTVLHLWVRDNELVKAGDRLLEIDPRDYQAALDNALARLDQAKSRESSAKADLELTEASTAADIAMAKSTLASAQSQVERARADVEAKRAEYERAQADVPRYQHLAQANAASREALERVIADARTSTANLAAAQHQVAVATANVAEAEARLAQAQTAPQQIAVKQAALRAATAEVEAAKANVEQARLNLSYTLISAPADGHVTKRSVNEGDVVQKDQTLLTLVSGEPWVTANFKETELTRMRPGQPVDIRIDAYPDRVFLGHVESIQRGTGARFSLLPPENATGNYVKVVQRVPVKIVFDEPPDADLALALGMSVVPTVHVGADPEGAAVPSAGPTVRR